MIIRNTTWQKPGMFISPVREWECSTTDWGEENAQSEILFSKFEAFEGQVFWVLLVLIL